MTPVYLGLGANLGEPAAQFAVAAAKLCQCRQVKLERGSSLYKGPAVGVGPQPDYTNAVVAIETDLAPRQLLNLTQEIERQTGRQACSQNLPRFLDMDILLFGNLILQEPDLIIPHPRLLERAFMLLPLAEIAPDVLHPAVNKRIAALAASVTTSGLWRLAGGSAWLAYSRNSEGPRSTGE